MAYIDRAVVYAINCLVRVRDNIDTVVKSRVKSLRAMKSLKIEKVLDRNETS
jgi:hypothetical protein